MQLSSRLNDRMINEYGIPLNPVEDMSVGATMYGNVLNDPDTSMRIRDTYYKANHPIDNEYKIYLDNSGFGYKVIEHNEYNILTGQYERKYSDVYIINPNGDTIPYLKQGDDRWSSIRLGVSPEVSNILESEGVASNIMMLNKGCVVTSDAIYYEYMGNSNADPRYVNNTGVENSSFNRANFNGREDVANQILPNQNLRLNKVYDSNEFTKDINNRVENGLPTILRYGDSSGEHSVVVGGYRMDSDGNILEYHISDPGYQNSPRTAVNASSFLYYRQPVYNLQNIQWYK